MIMLILVASPEARNPAINRYEQAVKNRKCEHEAQYINFALIPLRDIGVVQKAI